MLYCHLGTLWWMGEATSTLLLRPAHMPRTERVVIRRGAEQGALRPGQRSLLSVNEHARAEVQRRYVLRLGTTSRRAF